MRPNIQRLLGVNRVVSAMSAMDPLYPQEPTSIVAPATSEKCCQFRTLSARRYRIIAIGCSWVKSRAPFGIKLRTLMSLKYPYDFMKRTSLARSRRARVSTLHRCIGRSWMAFKALAMRATNNASPLDSCSMAFPWTIRRCSAATNRRAAWGSIPTPSDEWERRAATHRTAARH